MTQPPRAYTVRPATEADLERINTIWYVSEIEGEANPPAQIAPLALFPYTMREGNLQVALDDGGTILGFGGAFTWPTRHGSLTYLSDLFVAPETQSRGVGQALMTALMSEDGAQCVIASHDPRAHSLYIRNGMVPQWPIYWLVADDLRQINQHALPGADLAIEPAAPNDTEIVRWDAEICGYQRPADLRWLVETRAAESFWLLRDGEQVGYGYIQRYADEALFRPNAWTLGPIGARTSDAAAACVGALVRAASQRAPSIRICVHGPHPALAPLLAAGMRISAVETYLATPQGTPFDPTRYIECGALL